MSACSTGWSRAGHEVFAAISFMEEHDMQLYSRRLKWMERNLGSVDTQRHAYVEAWGL